jgi:hypothetical protein
LDPKILPIIFEIEPPMMSVFAVFSSLIAYASALLCCSCGDVGGE